MLTIEKFFILLFWFHYHEMQVFTQPDIFLLQDHCKCENLDTTLNSAPNFETDGRELKDKELSYLGTVYAIKKKKKNNRFVYFPICQGILINEMNAVVTHHCIEQLSKSWSIVDFYFALGKDHDVRNQTNSNYSRKINGLMKMLTGDFLNFVSIITFNHSFIIGTDLGIFPVCLSTSIKIYKTDKLFAIARSYQSLTLPYHYVYESDNSNEDTFLFNSFKAKLIKLKANSSSIDSCFPIKICTKNPKLKQLMYGSDSGSPLLYYSEMDQRFEVIGIYDRDLQNFDGKLFNYKDVDIIKPSELFIPSSYNFTLTYFIYKWKKTCFSNGINERKNSKCPCNNDDDRIVDSIPYSKFNYAVRSNESSSRKIEPRIYNGDIVRKGEFKFAAVLYGTKYALISPGVGSKNPVYGLKLHYGCTAFIIHLSWAITAAHCKSFVSKKLIFEEGVYIGAGLDHKKQTISENSKLRRRIKSLDDIIMHNNYSGIGEDLFDIALIRTESPFDFGKETGIDQACLPESDPIKDPDALLLLFSMGYGKSVEEKWGTSKLYYFQTKFIKTMNNYIWTVDPISSTCKGDSGGPLVRYDINKRKFEVIGVQVFMLTELDGRCYPNDQIDVSLNLFDHMDWIRQYVKEGLCFI